MQQNGEGMTSNVIADLDKLLSGLSLSPDFRVELTREDALTRLSVSPPSRLYCGFTLEAANNDAAFGLYCDPDMSFDELDPLTFAPADIVTAIAHGRVRAREYRFAGLKAQTTGVISLADGKQLTHTRFYFPAPQWLCSEQVIEYRPYPT